mgnify:CR=1 FL=1
MEVLVQVLLRQQPQLQVFQYQELHQKMMILLLLLLLLLRQHFLVWFL